MEKERKCLLCGKVLTELPIMKAGICAPCQDRVRREAMGEQADTRTQAEKELRRQGVAPDQGKGQKKS